MMYDVESVGKNPIARTLTLVTCRRRRVPRRRRPHSKFSFKHYSPNRERRTVCAAVWRGMRVGCRQNCVCVREVFMCSNVAEGPEATTSQATHNLSSELNSKHFTCTQVVAQQVYIFTEHTHTHTHKAHAIAHTNGRERMNTTEKKTTTLHNHIGRRSLIWHRECNRMLLGEVKHFPYREYSIYQRNGPTILGMYVHCCVDAHAHHFELSPCGCVSHKGGKTHHTFHISTLYIHI